ncbi:isochorismate synthase [Acerihabitans arboris]|uniref:isochorismate synthase n=1 Tax=Acerihabitans arboris TaxID=2691583 RepID=A0A845SJ99_9GAMM|nr:isochorismate synthase [Acerihabitans arboris]NDL65273.1 isochorismate synthase [Acerihabitans arboris]
MLSLLKTSLQQHIDAGIPAGPGVRQISLPWTPGSHVPMLDWLNTCTLYPQFYWQHRDGAQEAASCGGLLTFDRLSAAQRFLSTNRTAWPALRLWGINAFGNGNDNSEQNDGDDDSAGDGQNGHANGNDAGEPESCLLLPRLTWQRDAQSHRLVLNLASDVSLGDDARLCLAWLQQAAPATPLPPWTAQLREEVHQPERSRWRDTVAQALAQFGRGGLTKVVLARRTRLGFSGNINPHALMAASRRVNHDCYHYMLAWSAQRAFLGSSPERLYLRRQRQLDTEALAGTVASRSASATVGQLAQWLMNDDKNQRENLLVVDDICQRLQDSAITLDVMPPEVVRLRTVQHLRRAITARLDCRDDSRCLAMLQPTAAVAGLPRDAARAFIARHEPFDRQWYAGSAGYLSHAQAEFCVSLRCALAERQTLWLYAGAGIVEGSDAEREWQEVNNKAAGLRTLLTGDKPTAAN